VIWLKRKNAMGVQDGAIMFPAAEPVKNLKRKKENVMLSVSLRINK